MRPQYIQAWACLSPNSTYNIHIQDIAGQFTVFILCFIWDPNIRAWAWWLWFVQNNDILLKCKNATALWWNQNYVDYVGGDWLCLERYLLSNCEISNCILPSKILNILGMMMMYTKATIITMVMMMQVGPGDDYTLTVGGFNDALSTLGDSMFYHNGGKFSTK